MKIPIAVGCMAVVAFVFAASTHAAAEPPKQTVDGLVLVEGKRKDGMATVYARPGETLTAYKRVMLDPVEIAFDKKWMSQHPGVSADDRERIRQGLAEEFRSVFREELQEKGGYEVVETAAPDVLRVRAAIIDLYIEAPDAANKTRTGTYAVSVGRMTLIAELLDAESGAILARVADRQAATASGVPGVVYWTTSTTNRTEARRILRTWASRLRVALDSAREAAP